MWESNPRPHDYKSSALPTELTRRSRSEYPQAARRHSRHQPDTPTGVRWCLRAPLPFSQLRPRLAPERSSDLNEVPSLITDMTSGRRGGWDHGRPSWFVDRAPWSCAPARGRQCGRSASAVPPRVGLVRRAMTIGVRARLVQARATPRIARRAAAVRHCSRSLEGRVASSYRRQPNAAHTGIGRGRQPRHRRGRGGRGRRCGGRRPRRGRGGRRPGRRGRRRRCRRVVVGGGGVVVRRWWSAAPSSSWWSVGGRRLRRGRRGDDVGGGRRRGGRGRRSSWSAVVVVVVVVDVVWWSAAVVVVVVGDDVVWWSAAPSWSSWSTTSMVVVGGSVVVVVVDDVDRGGRRLRRGRRGRLTFRSAGVAQVEERFVVALELLQPINVGGTPLRACHRSG